MHSTSSLVSPVSAADANLSQNWVQDWGFRDELNRSDIDYENFWMDNAGKILMESAITNDAINADRAFGFIQSHITSSHYLPEVLVNSSMTNVTTSLGDYSCSNRIVLLGGSNESQSRELEELSLGNYYASPTLEDFIGADRIFYGNSAHRADSSVVLAIPNGFVKKASFSFDGLLFYTYLNVTVAVGDPCVQVSLQIQPMNSTFGVGNYTYLQVFAIASGSLRQYSFENATIFDVNGTLSRPAPFHNGTSPQSSDGLLIAYSNRTSVLDEDSVAIRFNQTDLYDIEHWYNNTAFDGLSWFGLGYNVPTTVAQGMLSPPVYADVYPIEHLDYHLLSDTAKYIVSNPLNVSVAPPVSFGFIAEGLALEAKLNPNNQTIQNLAKGYWNLYYSRYNSALYYTPYARSLNVFAFAGFELYGRNSTVEDFTRRFISNTSGVCIEEYAWGLAALHDLYECTNSSEDWTLYLSFLDSLSAGGSHFMALLRNSEKYQLFPNDTFEFGETASALMLGGVPFNYTAVIWAMNAVYQSLSNVNGTVYNRPFHGDLANTETLPAFILSTWLFENEMKNETGYWITALENTNVTSIAYSGDFLLIQAVGTNGSSLTITNQTGSYNYTIKGIMTIKINVPEFSAFLVLPLFMMMTLLGVIAYRKKTVRKYP